MAKPCLHCGEPSIDSDFCCFGCHTAYQLIRGAGLEAVYSQRERRWHRPNSVQKFEVFDHPDFLEVRAPLNHGVREADFFIEGLMCAACIWVIERLDRFHARVLESRVDFGKSTLHLKWKDGPKTLSEILTLLSKLGYEVSASEVSLRASQIPKREWIRLGIAGASAAATMHIGLLLIAAHSTGMESEDAQRLGFFAAITALPAVTFGALPFFKTTIQAFRLRQLSADFLISLAVILGYMTSLHNANVGKIESYFDALSMIVFLLLSGRILIRLATLSALKRPVWFARVHGALVPAESLPLDSQIQVQDGEVIPIDGRLKTTEAWVDQSAITGESIPTRFVAGQVLNQGAIARSNIELKTIHTAQDSYLEILYRRIQARDWISLPQKYELGFTIAILIIAGVAYFGSGHLAFTKMLAILIVTCPCALQLSRPLTLVAFKRQSQRQGISLLRLDRLLGWKNIRSIFFDKTGTLTMGAPELTREIQVNSPSLPSSTLNAAIYALATSNQHPLSRSIALVYADKERAVLQLQDINEIPGRGIIGQFENHSFELTRTESSSKDSMSTSFKIDGREITRFEFDDRMRPEVKATLEGLVQEGFEIQLASGDRGEVVEKFAATLAPTISKIHSEMTPAEKALLQTSSTAFVGDGLNDAEAMQAAGTSIGFSGSAEANLQAADAYLLKRDLMLIPALIEAAKRAQKTIWLNLALSMLYNGVCIVLVFLGYVGPVLCAIFMPLSSLTVILIASYRKYY